MKIVLLIPKILQIVVDIIVILLVHLKDLLKWLNNKFVFQVVLLWKDITNYVLLIIMEKKLMKYKI